VTRSSDQIGIDPFQGLTAKQCEVLDLLIEHKTSKEISRMLGISRHTVDQRILLARGKLRATTRSEVAQAYRRLLAERHLDAGQLGEERGDSGKPAASEIYHRSIYGSPRLALVGESRQEGRRDDSDSALPGDRPGQRTQGGPVQRLVAHGLSAPGSSVEPPEPFYHVLPEAFDGRFGTLLRLGAIVMITVFLTLVILGGLAIYSELSHLLDG